MKLLSKKLREKGFSLIELMVVVAIIGVLAAIAIPNFRTYRAKARTSEAKLHLSSIWTAEESFRNEYDGYGTCIARMGVSKGSKNYYAYGIVSGTTVHAGGDGNCTTVDNFPAIKTTAASVGELSALYATVVSDAEFDAQAAGTINAAGTDNLDDIWMIDEEKELKNPLSKL